jgi:hypothetical protein
VNNSGDVSERPATKKSEVPLTNRAIETPIATSAIE